MEIHNWQPIKDFEGSYEINRQGEVRSLYKRHFKKLVQQRIDWAGYYTVRLCKNGQEYTKYLHKLLAEVYIENPFNKPNVNHKNGNKRNNNLDNLEWCTQRENVIHAFATGLNKAHRKKVIDTCTDETYYSVMEAAKVYNIPYSTIKNYLNGNRSNPTCLKYAS